MAPGLDFSMSPVRHWLSLEQVSSQQVSGSHPLVGHLMSPGMAFKREPAVSLVQKSSSREEQTMSQQTAGEHPVEGHMIWVWSSSLSRLDPSDPQVGVKVAQVLSQHSVVVHGSVSQKIVSKSGLGTCPDRHVPLSKEAHVGLQQLAESQASPPGVSARGQNFSLGLSTSSKPVGHPEASKLSQLNWQHSSSEHVPSSQKTPSASGNGMEPDGHWYPEQVC
mmetsp:Transcript_39655/g.78096  ORF Transcript_39655/g.78096 Transcript_39655/m.78096 type:complete len:221 (+) Transcript_39655:659-1321(+)